MPQSRSRRIRFALVLFGPGLVLLFIQGLFSVLECFKPTKGFGFESVITVECIEIGVICREKVAGETMTKRIMAPLRFINFYLKNLFFSITRARFNILLTFFREMIP